MKRQHKHIVYRREKRTSKRVIAHFMNAVTPWFYATATELFEAAQEQTRMWASLLTPEAKERVERSTSKLIIFPVRDSRYSDREAL